MVKNTTCPEQLKKKHVAICYHRVCEACASEMIRMFKEDDLTNLADLLTKNLPSPRRQELIDEFYIDSVS